MVNSHYMADVGTCQTIQLLHLFGCIIVAIVHEVSPAQFFKMFLGIIGTTIPHGRNTLQKYVENRELPKSTQKVLKIKEY